MRAILATLCLAMLVVGCKSSRCCPAPGNQPEMVWTDPEPHRLLQAGVTTRAHLLKDVTPRVGDLYVVKRDGSHVKTFDELRAVLRPIETKEQALAYRRLLASMQLERSERLTALQYSTSVRFHEGDEAVFGVYVATQADRWQVGREPVIEQEEDAVVITGPVFRRLGDTSEGVVELVRETIHRDGRYERELVRVLETGEAALVHRPALLR